MPLTCRPNRRFAYLLALVLPLTMLVGAAGARADISFRVDYENGSCCGSGGWNGVQYESDRPLSESFAIVTNPVRQGQYAAKVVVQQAYSPFGWNESTEAGQGFSDQVEGADYYYAWSTMFDPSWVSPYGWGDFLQFYTHNFNKYGGPAPISLNTSGTHIDLSVMAGRYDEPGTLADGWEGWYTHPGTSTPSLIGYEFNQNYRLLDTLSLGRWNDFVMHVHWSGHNGRIQIWHRLPGESWLELIDVHAPTLRYDPQTNVSDDIGLIKQGFYRQSYCQQPTTLTACNSTLGVQPPDILYQDAFVRGSSFDEAVAAAFGGSEPSPSTAPAASAPAASSPPAVSQSNSQAAAAGPDLPRANLSPTTDSGCSACVASTSRGPGDVDATIAGGLDSIDTAYGLADFGGSSGWSGRVWTRDVIALAPSTALGANVAVLQQRDASDKLVWEIYLGQDRTIALWSPAGGLRADSINQSTGVAIDGQSHRIEVSALPNDSMVVRVDGQDRITLDGLSGSTSGNLRFLRAGIDHYDTGTSNEPISISHSDVGVSTLGWLGTRVSALAPTPAGGTAQSSGGAAPSPASNNASGTTGSQAAPGTPASKPSGGKASPSGGKASPRGTKASPSAGATGKTRHPSVGHPVIFVERPRVAARHTVLVRLATRPQNRLQIIVRDARGRALGSTYAVSTRQGRSLQLVALHSWQGQTRLNVIVKSQVAGHPHRTNMRIRLTKRELATIRGTH